MTGLAKRGIQVWRARTAIEVTVLVVGLFLGGTVGIGTVWFTFGIGPMVHVLLPASPARPDPERSVGDSRFVDREREAVEFHEHGRLLRTNDRFGHVAQFGRNHLVG